MKTLAFRLFNKAILFFGENKAKKFLWNSLEKVMRKTYPSVNGGGEHVCWRQIAINFNKPSVIDVGANKGNLSNFYLDIFPGAKVYAVEPIKEFFDTIDDSKLSKFNLALSNKKKTLTLYQSGMGSKPFNKNTKGKKTGIHDVPALPGDDFVKEFNIGKVNIIKIDVEGFDFEVLQGFVEVIKNDKPCIQFELSKWWVQVGYTLKQAETFFSDLDYELFHMTDDGFKEFSFQLPDSLFLTMNIFAKPKSMKLKNF